MRFAPLLACLLLTACAGSAPSALSEVSGGVFLHDIWRPEELKNKEKNSIDLNVEALSQPIYQTASSDLLTQIILEPRVHVGATVNTEGYTNSLYSGLTWGHEAESGLFTNFAFGGVVHDGDTHYRDNPSLPGLNYVITGRPQLGSALLFRESLEMGYRMDSGYGLALQLAHMSNAGLAGTNNDGMTFLGVRSSYKFK